MTRPDLGGLVAPGQRRMGDLAARLLGELATKGEIRPVIDRRFPLNGIVEAHGYVDDGHKRGNVVVAVA